MMFSQSAADEQSLHTSDLSFGAFGIAAESFGVGECIDIAVKLFAGNFVEAHVSDNEIWLILLYGVEQRCPMRKNVERKWGKSVFVGVEECSVFTVHSTIIYEINAHRFLLWQAFRGIAFTIPEALLHSFEIRENRAQNQVFFASR